MATPPVFKQPHLYPPELPAEFPQGLVMQFKLGDRVQWIPLPSTDWGVIIGLEYEWSEFLKSWNPMYCVLLAASSPSYQWIDRDWAWEWALQPVAAEAGRS